MSSRQSQYTEGYLATNEARGKGNGYTIGTYLAYTLAGKAKSFSAGYAKALYRSMENELAAGRAVTGRSARGYEAWYPVDSQVTNVSRETIEVRKSGECYA